MSSYIFDTSFLISLIHVDDINHEKSCALFGDLDANEHRFFISDLILSETYTVLAYKVDFSSVDILDRLLEKISIQYIGGNSEEYLGFFKLLKGKVSVADASVISDALKHGLEILAFDKKLLDIYRELHFGI